MPEAMFANARVAAAYDAIYPPSRDPAWPFVLALVADRAPRDIVDLGCGTGQLTVQLEALGRRVTGIDPSPRMLAVARAKPSTVHWVDGGAEQLGEAETDLVLMTSHVAQEFVGDDEWRDALGRIRRALRPGGTVAFDTRNPVAEGWRAWTLDRSRRTAQLTDGEVVAWADVQDVADGVVTYRYVSRFADGETVVQQNRMAFRGQEAITADLDTAGFSIDALHGWWDRSPVTDASPELIVIARAA